MAKCIAILLFLFPTKIVRLFLKIIHSNNFIIEKNVHVGFSLINVKKMILREGSRIGHFNIIKTKSLLLEGGKIGRQNIMKGNFDVLMLGKSWILNGNRFTANTEIYQNVFLTLNSNAAIIANHIFDLTDSITIGHGTVVAGAGSQMWTHSFFVTPQVSTGVRVDAPIVIGDFCYIGSRSIILSGVNIANGIVVGAGSCVSKNLDQQGCYVSQGLRHFPMNIDEKISSLGAPVLHDFIYRKRV